MQPRVLLCVIVRAQIDRVYWFIVAFMTLPIMICFVSFGCAYANLVAVLNYVSTDPIINAIILLIKSIEKQKKKLFDEHFKIK